MDYYNYGANGVNPFYGGQFPQMTNPYYQPQMVQQLQNQIQPSTPPQPQRDNMFVWVQGREGAKAYPVAPERTMIFLDDQEPYVYKKRTDKEGKTSEFKIFKLVEENEQPENTISKAPIQYVDTETFSNFSRDVSNTLNALKDEIHKLQDKSYQRYDKGGKRVN